MSDLYARENNPQSVVAGGLGLHNYRKATFADLVEALRDHDGVEEVAWCVVHKDLDAARPDTEDVRQVCGGSEFWSTGNRGDCTFTDVLVVPLDSREEQI